MKEMKNSGIEWIGKIPQDWTVGSVRYLFKIGRGRVIAQTELKSDGKYPVYSSQTKNDGCLGYIDTYDFCTDQLTWTTDGANAGTVFLRRGRYNCTNVCGTLCPNTKLIELRYQKYALEHIAFYHKRSDTNGYKIMNNEMAAIKTIIPPYYIQSQIADFLDDKCSKIDRYIEKQQQIIEKLKDYKQAVITEAVTKGLDSNVPVKDSGVEWIGMIPEHWEIRKFGNVASVKSNLVHPQQYKNYPQVSSENIEKNSGKLLECKTVDETGIISDNHLFFKGQVLYSKIRPALNKAAIAPFDGLCSADIYPIETSENIKFMLYTILSESFLEQVKMITENRVKMPKINQSELNRIFVVSVPHEEQEQIVSFLDEKCSVIDRELLKRELIVGRLEEYKKSLIYEAITGKMEV